MGTQGETGRHTALNPRGYPPFQLKNLGLMAGIWAAGNSIMPLAEGAAHGSDFQEAAIAVVAYSAAPTGITSFALILWGLRTVTSQSQGG